MVRLLGVEQARLDVVFELQLHHVLDLAHELAVKDGEAGLDAVIEVAHHPVGRGEVELLVAAVVEQEHAGVLEEAIDDADGADVFAQARHARHERADGPGDDVDADARLTGLVQLFDHFGCLQAVHLDEHVGLAAPSRLVDLEVDQVDEARAQVEFADEQVLERLGGRLHRFQVGKYACHLGGDPFVGGEQAVVAVDAGRVFVEVAGAEVGIEAMRLPLLPHDEGQFAVHLHARERVAHVHARLLQLFAPAQVGLLVEARLDLDEGEHLLAAPCRLHEGVHDAGAPRHPVQDDLDVGDGRIDRCLLEHAHHALVAVVGHVDEVIAFGNLAEKVVRLLEAAVGDGRQGRVLQVRHPEVGKAEEVEVVVVPALDEQVPAFQLELLAEEIEQLTGHRSVVDEARGRPHVALGQARLDLLDQVARKLVVDVELGVAGELDGVGIHDLVTRKHLAHVVAHHVVEHDDVVLARQGRQHQEARQVIGRDFYDGVLRGARLAVAHVERQVEGGVVEERPHLVGHQQHGLHEGQHVVVEVVLDELALLLVQVEPPQQVDVVVGQFGHDLVLEDVAELLLLPVDDLEDLFEQLLGVVVQFALGFLAHAQQVAVLRHPYPEKFVQVIGIDGQELDAFEQGHGRVFGLLQDAVIE